MDILFTVKLYISKKTEENEKFLQSWVRLIRLSVSVTITASGKNTRYSNLGKLSGTELREWTATQ